MRKIFFDKLDLTFQNEIDFTYAIFETLNENNNDI